jgi:hypothetical protein
VRLAGVDGLGVLGFLTAHLSALHSKEMSSVRCSGHLAKPTECRSIQSEWGSLLRKFREFRILDEISQSDNRLPEFDVTAIQ